jgi:hypothetical protein
VKQSFLFNLISKVKKRWRRLTMMVLLHSAYIHATKLVGCVRIKIGRKEFLWKMTFRTIIFFSSDDYFSGKTRPTDILSTEVGHKLWSRKLMEKWKQLKNLELKTSGNNVIKLCNLSFRSEEIGSDSPAARMLVDSIKVSPLSICAAASFLQV